MKPEIRDRERLARHEAAHLLALRAMGPVHQLQWRRCGQAREICHCSAPAPTADWEDGEVRNAAIASRAFVAVAGGAWESLSDGSVEAAGLETIHRYCGAIDFELAHEWLTLQRYDGDQEAIEQDLQRLFDSARLFLSAGPQRRALEIVAGRLLGAIRRADRAGRTSLSLPADHLLRGVELSRPPLLRLEATIR